MNTHTAVNAIASQLGVQAENMVNVHERGAAVRAAIAEAYLTNEVQSVFGDDGVDFEVL